MTRRSIDHREASKKQTTVQDKEMFLKGRAQALQDVEDAMRGQVPATQLPNYSPADIQFFFNPDVQPDFYRVDSKTGEITTPEGDAIQFSITKPPAKR